MQKEKREVTLFEKIRGWLGFLFFTFAILGAIEEGEVEEEPTNGYL